jgi:hypothetical protein
LDCLLAVFPHRRSGTPTIGLEEPMRYTETNKRPQTASSAPPHYRLSCYKTAGQPSPHQRNFPVVVSDEFHSLFSIQIIQKVILQLPGTLLQTLHVLNDGVVDGEVDLKVATIAKTGKGQRHGALARVV